MPAPSLAGKKALVTGASRGIGRAIAQRLAAAGATVVVSARSLDNAAQAGIAGTLAETVGLIEKAGGRAIPLAADLEKASDREALVGRAAQALGGSHGGGGLDILVNNAGFAHYERVETMPVAMFDRTVDHYFKSPFVLAQAAIPFMKKAGAGWIVNIGSSEAQPPIRPYLDHNKAGGGVIYGAIKAALARFTQGLAAELVDSNIAVNLVAPSGAIRTPGADRLIPKDFPCEDVEYLAETVLAMCHLPAAERTGLITHSMHFPRAVNLEVYTLDGKGRMPPAAEPQWGHPLIRPDGVYP